MILQVSLRVYLSWVTSLVLTFKFHSKHPIGHLSTFIFCFCFLELGLQHMEVLRLGAAWSSSCQPMPQPHQTLNPLSKARDQTCILTDSSQIHFHWAMLGTPLTPFLALYIFWEIKMPYRIQKFASVELCPSALPYTKGFTSMISLNLYNNTWK